MCPKKVPRCARDPFPSLLPPRPRCKWNPGHMYIYTRGAPPATYSYTCIYINRYA